MTDLRVDWCSFEAARYAVKTWHYSRSMPSCKLAKIGVWEDGKFVGCIIFGLGATPQLCKPYGLKGEEVCELVRIAMREHATPVSRCVSIAISMLKKQSPGLRLVVSFADPEQGHIGKVYQASGWLYLGDTGAQKYLRVRGEVVHPRTLGSKYGRNGQSLAWLRANVDPGAERVDKPAKFRYVYPLDRPMARRIAPMVRPAPKSLATAVADGPPVPPAVGVQPDPVAPVLPAK